MKNLLTAIALTIALPAVAHAQAAPAPAPKASCCEAMKDKMDCGNDMAKMHEGMSGMNGMNGMNGMKAGGGMPAGQDMSQSGAKAPAADAHQNHQK